MGSPRFAGLDKRMSAAAAAVVKADDDEELPADDECKCADKKNCTCKKKELDMTEKPAAAAPVLAAVEAIAEPINASAPDLNARLKAVAADERIKGRESAALEMLADAEFDGLSAEAVCKLVAKTPLAAADSDGAKMLAAIESGGNPDLGNGGGDAKESTEAEQAKEYFANAHAEIQQSRAA